MLRINSLILGLIFICSPLFAQDTIFAEARQLYHKEYINNPVESPHIFDLVDLLGKKHYFTAVCPTNGGQPKLLRNEGRAIHIAPSPVQLHEWEPHSWQWFEENNSWKGICPGDSVFFEYTVELDDRQDCAPELDLPAWGENSNNNPWWVESSENGIQSNGSIYTYLGIDGLFDKPLIMVEGFDFLPGANLEDHRHGGFGWNEIWGCNTENYPGTQNYPIILDSLHNEGYDIVFIDFEHGTASIENKSILVKHAIRLCNEFKCSNNANVIIGASMGGVVARHSLTTMEHEGEQHCCRVFASIDAPHKGANISPGLQAIVHILASQSSEAAIFSAGLNSPAAKQLLHFNFEESEDHLQAMSMLDNLGLPKTSINLAVANSNPDVEIDLELAPLLHWSEYYFPIGNAHLIANRTTSQAEGFQQIASCALPVDFNPFNGDQMWYEEQMYYYNNGIDRDIEPSSLGRHTSALVNAINASGALSISENQYQGACGFISYNSALSINPGEVPSFDRWHNAATWEAPEEHVELSYLHRKLILDNIILGNEIAPAELNSETIEAYFEYGHSDLPTNWIGSTSIHSGGTVAVGESDILVYPAHTKVRSRPCDALIDLGESGSLRVGVPNSENSGELFLDEGAILTSTGKNDFTIYEGSKLVVGKGALLILEHSDLDIQNEAQLIIEEGGTLILKNTSKINLLGNTSKFICEGSVLIEGTGISQIESLGSTSSTISFKIGSDILIAGNSKFRIKGNDVAQVFIEDEHSLGINGTGLVSILNSTLFLPGNSAIHSEATLSINESSAYGEGGATVKSTSKLIIDDCIWSNLDIVLESAGPKSLKLLDSDVEDSQIYLHESGFHISSNYISSSSIKCLESIGPSHLEHNVVNGFEEALVPVVDLEECSELVIQNNSFNDGNNCLRIASSPAIVKCNLFNSWNEALITEGESVIKMTPQQGGGYNQFINNRLHIRLINANLPLLQNGRNSFGNHGVYCFSGSIIEPVNIWSITGNSWLTSSLSNGSNGGELSANTWCTTTSIPMIITVVNPNLSTQDCPINDDILSDFSGKNIRLDMNYDVLGRNIIENDKAISKNSANGQGQLNILSNPFQK